MVGLGPVAGLEFRIDCGGEALQVGAFLSKLVFFCWLFILIRWTLPRFRYDQVMRLGWQMLLPLALANLIITAVWLVA